MDTREGIAIGSDYIAEEEPMSRKTLGYILVAVGLIVLVVSAFADSLGIGGAPGFGPRQIAGSVGGLVVAIVGFWLATRKAS